MFNETAMERLVHSRVSSLLVLTREIYFLSRTDTFVIQREQYHLSDC